VLLGPAPERSPSLEDYGNADHAVQRLARELWGDIDGKGVKTHKVGKGMVMNGLSIEEAFGLLKLAPDFNKGASDSLLFIHRSIEGEDLYFISNQSVNKVSVEPAFRVLGKAPFLFDPLLGSVRRLPEFTQEGGMIRVPLVMEGHQSFFVVFRKPGGIPGGMNFPRGGSVGTGKNFPAPVRVVEVAGPWRVHFDTAMRGPAAPVTFDQLKDWRLSDDTSIKYYAGAAVYKNSFNWTSVGGKRIYLDLGTVSVMAKVKVNGKYAGGVWTAPYWVDITGAVKAGKNLVEIEVVNTWVNRLIGDSRLAESNRKTWAHVNPYKPDSELAPSGLLGPVKVIVFKE
jgi:hypothetical protein